MNEIRTKLTSALADRYGFERELGAGGMATVYLADDLKHDRKVAIKVLRPELSAVVGGERFLAEIRTTANLQHPHILPLFDSGEARGLLWYAMPYVDGESLRERIDREKQLPVGEAVAIATKVLGALGAAHDAGIVHRDVKPANVLLDARGEPLIADFGIALAVREAGGGRLTETGLSLGTPYYMSPEQATGDRDPDARSDLYSVGAMLYEMLTGEPPFSGATAQSIVGRILTTEPARPSEARPSIPPNVEAAVLTALEKTPADRFQRANEFVRALSDPSFQHVQVTAEVGASGGGRGVSRRMFGATLALAVGAVAVTALVAGGDPSTTPPTPVTYAYQVDLPDGVSAFTNHGIGVALSPDGSTLVFQATGDQPLWIRRPGELAPQPLSVREYAVHPRFSPDGRSIAYVGDDLDLRTMRLDGSELRVLVPGPLASVFGGLAWGGDGFIYFVRRDDSTWRVSQAGGTPEMILDPETHGRTGAVDALPDGRGLLFTGRFLPPVPDTIRVLDLETGEVRSLFSGTTARWTDSGHLVYVDEAGVLYRRPFDLERLVATGQPERVGDGVEVPREPSAQFAVSRSGSLAYAPAAESPSGVPVWLDGSGPPIPVSGLPSDVAAVETSVSPDGTRIALLRQTAGRSEVAVFDREDESLTPIASSDEMGGLFWSPQGDEVGYWGRDDGVSEVSIYSRPVDLSAPARTLWTRTGGAADVVTSIVPQWTPAGDRLIVMVSRGELFSVTPLPDSSSTSLFGSFGRGLLDQFEISPNGDWLAYGYLADVFVRPISGGGDERQVSSADGGWPQWAPSGDALLYVAYGDRRWHTVDLGRASDPRLVSDEVWLADAEDDIQRRMFDVAPDGRVLAIRVDPGGEDARAPIVVVNWSSQFEPGAERR